MNLEDDVKCKTVILALIFCSFLLGTPSASAGCVSAWFHSLFAPEKNAENLIPRAPVTTLSHDLNTIRQIRVLQPEERDAAIRAYAYPTRRAFMHRAFVIADWVLATVIGMKVIDALQKDPYQTIPAALLILPTLYMADLGSQFFHKWLDSYASESNPIWGSTAVEFRHHHEYPNNLNDIDYASNVSAAATMLAPFFAISAAASDSLSPYASSSALLFLMSVMHTTEFHRQAHLKRPTILFSFLQKVRLSLNRQEHLGHHKPPFDNTFAVFNGWSNALLDRVNLWTKLDRIFWTFRRRMPNNWIQDPRSIPRDVIEELAIELSKVGPDLAAYAQTFPQRVPADLRHVITEGHQAWRSDFIDIRKKIYLNMAKSDPTRAQTEWAQEQLHYAWIYGPLFIALEE